MHIDCLYSSDVWSLIKIAEKDFSSDFASFVENAKATRNYNSLCAWTATYYDAGNYGVLKSKSAETGGLDALRIEGQDWMFTESNTSHKRCKLNECLITKPLLRKSISEWECSRISNWIAKSVTDKKTIDLRLLRTCRQFYQEANSRFWATRVFSFKDGNAFANFVLRRSSIQLNLLRKIRIRVGSGSAYRGWLGAALCFVGALTGLEVLYLDLVWPLDNLYTDEWFLKRNFNFVLTLTETLRAKINAIMQVSVRFGRSCSYSKVELSLSERIKLVEKLASRISSRDTLHWVV